MYFILQKKKSLKEENWKLLTSAGFVLFLFVLASEKQGLLYTRNKQRLTTSNLWWIFDERLSVSFGCYFSGFIVINNVLESGCGRRVLQKDIKKEKMEKNGK